VTHALGTTFPVTMERVAIGLVLTDSTRGAMRRSHVRMTGTLAPPGGTTEKYSAGMWWRLSRFGKVWWWL
jgi:hypothetical protein